MSTPLDREPSPDKLSPYAPRWARERLTAQRAVVPDVTDDDVFSADPPLGDTSRRFGMPPSLAPTILAEPEMGGRSWIGRVAAAVLAVSAAAVVALLVVRVLPAGSTRISVHEPAAEAGSFSSRYSDRASGGTTRLEPQLPQLIVARAPVGQNEDAFPLGLTVSGARTGAAVVVSGLADGATLSSGQSAGPGSWRLAVTELDGAAIRPPPGFAGTMEVLAELRLGDGTVVERRSLHFERAPAPPAPRRVMRQIDPEEMAALIKRGEDYIATGDLASARLVLQRAAEGGDARAALELAGTYDPNVLEQLGVKGFAPDVGQALAWYEKARDFGSAEAPRRLERLASREDR